MPDELVEGREVELVAVEVEQLTEHDAQAALPARLRGQLGHDVVGAHDDEPIAGQRLQRRRVRLRVDLGDDVPGKR